MFSSPFPVRPPHPRQRLACAAASALIALLGALPWRTACAAPDPMERLRIVGGLASINQYVRLEEPFWTQEVPRLTGGKLAAEIVPFDRAGIRAQDMLRLMGLGIVPFGTALLSTNAAEVPIVAAPDLAGLNPDMPSLRRNVAAFRPLLEATLKQRFGIKLLAVYTYPAQVLFCKQPFKGLDGLAGRRVRVSSVALADFVQALGATPVRTNFAEIMPQMRADNLDCAVTGTMSGNTIGLHEVTSHVQSMALGWGLAIFGANENAWHALPNAQQAQLQQGLQRLEQAIWDESVRETGDGLACNIGASTCSNGKRGRMSEVHTRADDERRRREIFAQTVLPRWVQRCGAECANAWNHTIGPALGILAKAP